MWLCLAVLASEFSESCFVHGLFGNDTQNALNKHRDDCSICYRTVGVYSSYGRAKIAHLKQAVVVAEIVSTGSSATILASEA